MERGIIKRISEATSLERHQVAAVLSNRAKYVSMDTLAALCEYLIQHHQFSRAELPGTLFRIEPEEFSALVGNRKLVQVCIGMWTDKRKSTKAGKSRPLGAGPQQGDAAPRRRWVMASDSYLLGILLRELFALGSETHPERVEQCLVSAFTGEVGLAEVKHEAESVFRAFQQSTEDRALVCLGSVKSNVAIEPVVAESFHAEPFLSQDGVRRPKDRSCPFFLRYRDDDAQTPSCHGGVRLARSKETAQPGIYFETPGGWTCCPSNDEEDAALVFYAYHVPQAELEVVLGGFSGRATHCLAASLRSIAGKLWPPTYDDGELQLGVFIVRFGFEPSSGQPGETFGTERTYRPSSTEVIPLEEKVLKQKVARKAAKKSLP